MAPRLDADAPQNGMRLPLRGFREFRIALRDKAFGLGRAHHPHHARPIASQRYEYARALRRMKFSRDVSMRPRMHDIERQRGLVEIAPSYVDPGGFAAQRMPAVGT